MGQEERALSSTMLLQILVSRPFPASSAYAGFPMPCLLWPPTTRSLSSRATC